MREREQFQRDTNTNTHTHNIYTHTKKGGLLWNTLSGLDSSLKKSSFKQVFKNKIKIFVAGKGLRDRQGRERQTERERGNVSVEK